MDRDRFDELTRSLAIGTTRRRVLGMVGGAVATALGLRTANAQSECSAFCQTLPPGRQRGQCRSQCAQGTGPFYSCEGDAERLCLQSTGEVTCCGAGETCVDGVCEGTPPPDPCEGVDCDDGDPCTADTCQNGQCFHEPISGCCPPTTCPDPTTVLNTETCSCECPVDPSCVEPRQTDPVTCVCECPDDPPCAAPWIVESSTCQCVCPVGFEQCGEDCLPVCPESEARDPENCQCVESTGCVFDDDCDDGDPCTEDLCVVVNGTGTCSNTPIAGCAPCDADDQCQTGDPCVLGYCYFDDGGGGSISSVGGVRALPATQSVAQGRCVTEPACQSSNPCVAAICNPNPGPGEDMCSVEPICATGEACHLGRCYVPGVCTAEQAFACGLDFDQYQEGVCGPDVNILCHCYTTPTGGQACVLDEFCPETQECGPDFTCGAGRVCVMSCCGPRIDGGDGCCDDGNLYPRCFRECPPAVPE